MAPRNVLLRNPGLSERAIGEDGDVGAKDPVVAVYPLQVDVDEFYGRQLTGLDQPRLIANPQIADVLIYGTFSFAR